MQEDSVTISQKTLKPIRSQSLRTIMSNPKPKFKNIKLPTAMMDAVADVIERHPECAWKSTADFVRDAVRQLLWIEKQLK